MTVATPETRKTVAVTIRWDPAGRRVPPIGPRYAAVARFSEYPADGPYGAWSIVLEFPPQPVHETPYAGFAYFLVEWAPNERLKPGARFEVLEGPKKVADVVVEG